MASIQLYDTTLRDGAQQEGISFSVVDKLKIAQKLDELGIHFIEGGWPGSNPKDVEFFEKARNLTLSHAKLVAFGSTRRPKTKTGTDANLVALADAGVKVGLSREDALALSNQTVLGAAKLLIETKEHPGRLKDMVTSPGGTAIAGIHTLEKGGLRTTLINAVEVATKRSKELGEIMIKNFSDE